MYIRAGAIVSFFILIILCLATFITLNGVSYTPMNNYMNTSEIEEMSRSTYRHIPNQDIFKAITKIPNDEYINSRASSSLLFTLEDIENTPKNIVHKINRRSPDNTDTFLLPFFANTKGVGEDSVVTFITENEKVNVHGVMFSVAMKNTRFTEKAINLYLENNDSIGKAGIRDNDYLYFALVNSSKNIKKIKRELMAARNDLNAYIERTKELVLKKAMDKIVMKMDQLIQYRIQEAENVKIHLKSIQSELNEKNRGFLAKLSSYFVFLENMELGVPQAVEEMEYFLQNMAEVLKISGGSIREMFRQYTSDFQGLLWYLQRNRDRMFKISSVPDLFKASDSAIGHYITLLKFYNEKCADFVNTHKRKDLKNKKANYTNTLGWLDEQISSIDDGYLDEIIQEVKKEVTNEIANMEDEEFSSSASKIAAYIPLVLCLVPLYILLFLSMY
ncbi:hypothetical protein NEMIN01_1001 [Nematocida minor]|uniref:uncharacterized protein n=1 Tax=Nematocida minor TaxID=1912983 RepID=UPI002220E2E0|nr:uncharacterized protein NEMIN01_1001 [Nematocida minor]KAI5190377.1 hypothetical protein NEMIN01_1001 [Nematocida minor]